MKRSERGNFARYSRPKFQALHAPHFRGLALRLLLLNVVADAMRPMNVLVLSADVSWLGLHDVVIYIIAASEWEKNDENEKSRNTKSRVSLSKRTQPPLIPLRPWNYL